VPKLQPARMLHRTDTMRAYAHHASTRLLCSAAFLLGPVASVEGRFSEQRCDVPSWTAGVSPASSRQWELRSSQQLLRTSGSWRQSGRDARGPQKLGSCASYFRSSSYRFLCYRPRQHSPVSMGQALHGAGETRFRGPANWRDRHPALSPDGGELEKGKHDPSAHSPFTTRSREPGSDSGASAAATR